MMGTILEFTSDILLAVGALAAAFYCVVLSRKLNRLTGLDQELGGAIALLSQQVDEMTSVLHAAQNSATGARDELAELTQKAEEVTERLQTVTQQAPEVAAFAADAVEQMPKPADEGGLKDGATSLFVRHAERVAK